jgi:leader peptidase (prepilin peptidase)/N-methyltransferase
VAIRLEAAFRADAHPWRAVLAAALAAACAPRAVAPEVLELLQKRPLNPSGVYLNESLVFHFSKDLDRASVNPQSVRIAAPDGRGPKGTIQVEGDELRFVPDPVLASDLSDGGYLPDTEYTVRFLGFPNPDGLRSAEGAPLARTETWVFRTVPVGAPREGPVFEDSSPEVGLPIQIASRGIRDVPPNGPITLEGGEPVDPSTFLAEDFELRPVLGGRERNREAPVKGERIPLRARIAHNRDPRSGDGRTILQLWPERVLDRGRYVLAVQPDTVHLRDFGGHPVWPFSVRRLEIEVGGRETPAASNSFLVSFLDTDLRSSAEVPEVDGTAHWSSSGRVEVRFPAAAGSGVDGNLALAGDVHSRDVNAVRLDVARGQTATLAPEPGLVILRAQKRLSIDGTLVRRAAGEQPPVPTSGSLSSWLESLRTWGSTCTLLIAGGDLSITGRIEVDGPLVIVAGGRIRFSGAIALGPVDPQSTQRGPVEVPLEHAQSRHRDPRGRPGPPDAEAGRGRGDLAAAGDRSARRQSAARSATPGGAVGADPAQRSRRELALARAPGRPRRRRPLARAFRGRARDAGRRERGDRRRRPRAPARVPAAALAHRARGAARAPVGPAVGAPRRGLLGRGAGAVSWYELAPAGRAAIAGLFGLFVGSFLNVAIHRLPREGMSVSHPRRSLCPSCGRTLTWAENVPLVSWTVQLGRCRGCGWRIPWRYPLVEALNAVLWGVAAWRLTAAEWPLLLIQALVLSGLIVATFVDFDCFEIPDEVSIGGIVLAPIASLAWPALHEDSWVAQQVSQGAAVDRGGALAACLAGMAVGGGVLLAIGWIGKRVYGRDAMGLGDVKLLCGAGGFLGPAAPWRRC